MGYACPVCETPQADARHLADHLALTALLGDDDHEAWLDDRAPGWEHDDDAGLAERVVDAAEEIDLPTDDHDHAQDHSFADGDHDPSFADGDHDPSFGDSDHDPGVAFDDVDTANVGVPRQLDDDAREALREAYELTRARREDAEDERDDEST